MILFFTELPFEHPNDFTETVLCGAQRRFLCTQELFVLFSGLLQRLRRLIVRPGGGQGATR
ncbi:MAG TPA: hypothetical protein VKR81_05655, partial [Candidatus Binatia bacterium]|nr:hypothetical protein [Candidatus Binatia bacterium]